MAHRHLVLAYVLTWVLQLGYVAFLAVKWRGERRKSGGRDAPGGMSKSHLRLPEIPPQ
jgi:hypothetical protein